MTNLNEPRRAVIYARLACGIQHGIDPELNFQLKKGREFARENGLEVIEEISETGHPAQGLEAVYLLADQGRIDAVIVRDLSRLGRNSLVLLDLHERFQNLGVEIITLRHGMQKDAGTLIHNMHTIFSSINNTIKNERSKHENQ